MARLSMGSRFKNLVDKARGLFKKAYSSVYYDLWKEIENNPWDKKPDPTEPAKKWLTEYIKDQSVHYKGKTLSQGQLYIYDYKTPKWESRLDFFDTQPLALCIGTAQTSLGLRDVCINLHMLPPSVRRFVLHQIYNMFKSYYKKNLNRKDQRSVQVNWKDIKKPLEEFGIGFAIRMYIPELRKNVIEFKQEDWSKAIYLPSNAYSAKDSSGKHGTISPAYIEKQYRDYMANFHRNSPATGEGY